MDGQLVLYLGMTAFIGSIIPIFYFSVIKPVAKSHYQMIDKDIQSGLLSKSSTVEEVRDWGFKKLHVYLDETQISETMEYVRDGKKHGIF